jgi:S1-C subfamily serine protease
MKASLLIATSMLVVVTACHPAPPNYASSCSSQFNAVALQGQARGAIVQIISDVGTGTGFIVSKDKDGILIATNNHVIRDGSTFAVKFESGAQVADVKIAKIDADHDLALLKTPSLGDATPVLTMSQRTVVLGERVGAIGYPFVRGETPTMTFEDGGVTSVNVDMDGQNYIQTNANINPGSSGSPVIDACGVVVGVVVAVHTETQRTGFVIPVERLRTLVAATTAPRATPQVEIGGRVKALETAIHYRKGPEVAAVFSHNMLNDKALKAFKIELDSSFKNACDRVDVALAEMKKEGKPYKEDGHVITSCSALPADDRKTLIETLLTDREKEDFELAQMVMDEKVDMNTAMNYWFGQFANELFGENPTFTVDKVVATGDTAQSQIMIGSGDAAQYWQFDWVYERGDWRIDGIECVRGCGS